MSQLFSEWWMMFSQSGLNPLKNAIKEKNFSGQNVHVLQLSLNFPFKLDKVKIPSYKKFTKTDVTYNHISLFQV